ncbi:hypothetical protein BGZ63DRAFT_434720 [Mariannaea sp. PMI_226]|nr:hypothetical protein BGZ63DRAFT_434720 [Mariannaea sp. PMI_226]
MKMEATIKGTFTPCDPAEGPGKRFGLTYTCSGTQCLDLDGFMGANCKKDGTDWSCTNGVECSSATHLQSEFEYDLQGLQIISFSRLYSLNDCKFSLVGDEKAASIPEDLDTCSAGSSDAKSTATESSKTATETDSSGDGSNTFPPGSSTVYSFIPGTGTETSLPSNTNFVSGSSAPTLIPSTKLFVFYAMFWLMGFMMEAVNAADSASLQEKRFYIDTHLPGLLQRSTASEAEEELMEIEELFADYFLGKGGDLLTGEDWIPDSFMDAILEAGCGFLVGEASKPVVDAIVAAIGAPFIEDCVLSVNSLVLVLAPELLVPALIGGGLLCDYLLEKFVNAALHTDALEELLCGPLSEDESSTSTITKATATETFASETTSDTSVIVETETETTVTEQPTDSSTVTSDTVTRETTTLPTGSDHTQPSATETHTRSPAKPSLHLSGWTFDLPDLLWWENDISTTLDDASLFLDVDGVKTVNTKCVAGDDFSLAGDPITADKGDIYVFETKGEPDPDTCCLAIYSNSNCKEVTGQVSKTCDVVDSKPLPIDVRSWKIYGCQGIWTGEP